MVLLRYNKGTILAWGDVKVPNSSWDPRVGAFRAMAMYYPEILKFMRLSRLDFKDDVLDLHLVQSSYACMFIPDFCFENACMHA